MRTPEELEAATGMSFRDALADIAQIPYRTVAEARATEHPFVTVVIPTHKRLDFLTEAVRSVLAQDFARPVEIVITDDDPASTVADALLARLPELRRCDFRYVVNERNLGLYSNHNRGIQLARGEWVAFLDDDNLLEPDFLGSLFAIIDRQPTVQAILPRNSTFDERPGVAQHGQGRSVAWHVASRLLIEWNFLGRSYRRFPVGKFFWGAVYEGSGGCLFRTSHLREVGGFYPEELPTSDLWMMARYARLFGLYQARVKGFRIRIAENESGNPATIRKGLYWGHKLQSSLVGRDVPGWYRRLLPHMFAQYRAEVRDFWKVDVPEREVEAVIGAPLPKPRRVLLRAAQTALRGF